MDRYFVNRTELITKNMQILFKLLALENEVNRNMHNRKFASAGKMTSNRRLCSVRQHGGGARNARVDVCIEAQLSTYTNIHSNCPGMNAHRFFDQS